MNELPPTPAQRRMVWLALTGLSVATILLLVGGMVWGLARLLDVLGPVLWPLAIGGVVACVLAPLVDWLEGHKVPRLRAILLVFVVVFALVLRRVVAVFAGGSGSSRSFLRRHLLIHVNFPQP